MGPTTSVEGIVGFYVGDEPSVGRPRRRPLRGWALCQPLHLSRSVGTLAIEVVGPIHVRAERQVLTIGRPDLLGVARLIEGQTGRHTSLEIVDPDVPVSVAQNR